MQQQAKLGRPECYQLFTGADLVTLGFQQNATQLDALGYAFRLTAAQLCADPGQQFLQGKRLDQVVVGATVQALHAIGDFAARGQHDNGQVVKALLAAQHAQPLQATGVRQHPVEQDQIVWQAIQGAASRANIRDAAGMVTRLGK